MELKIKDKKIINIFLADILLVMILAMIKIRNCILILLLFLCIIYFMRINKSVIKSRSISLKDFTINLLKVSAILFSVYIIVVYI